MPHQEPITGKIVENEIGSWYYIVYTGDGTKPGSVSSAAGGYDDPEDCIQKLVGSMKRTKKMRDCQHEFDDKHYCIHCRMCGMGSEDN